MIQGGDGTIDITDTVEQMRSTFVVWAVSYITGLAVASPNFAWLGLPGIKTVLEKVVKWVAEALAGSAVMGAFFLNTVLRKPAQAVDYVKAVAAKNALPPEASDEEYEKAEIAECLAFDRFISWTN